MKQKIAPVFEVLISVAALFGVVLMYFVYPHTVSGNDALDPRLNYFFFFTILSNIFVSALFAGKFFFRKGKAGAFFADPVVHGAVTVYISITGLIFFFLLREVYKRPGLDFNLANTILHNAVPIAVFLYWAVFMRTAKYRPVHVLYWLAFPVLYLTVTLVRGAVIHWYPYPFVNVITYGYPKVLVTSAVMAVIFAAMGFALVGLSRIKIGKAK